MCSVCGYLHLTVGTRRLWAFNFLAQQQIGWENTLGRGVIVYALKITLDQIRDTKNGARRILWNLMPQWNMHNLCSVGTFTRNALYSKICNSHTFPYSQNGQKVEFQPKKPKNAFFWKTHRDFFQNFDWNITLWVPNLFRYFLDLDMEFEFFDPIQYCVYFMLIIKGMWILGMLLQLPLVTVAVM